MGRSQLENQTKQTSSPKEILNYLDELCAYALSIGMTYEQYWYGDPKLLNTYIRAEEFRRTRRNQELWLQGLYVHYAIGTLVPVLNPFSKDKKAKSYLKEPLPISEKDLEERRLKRIEKWTKMMMSKVEKK